MELGINKKAPGRAPTIKQVLPAEKSKRSTSKMLVLLFTRLALQGIVCYTLWGQKSESDTPESPDSGRGRRLRRPVCRHPRNTFEYNQTGRGRRPRRPVHRHRSFVTGCRGRQPLPCRISPERQGNRFLPRQHKSRREYTKIYKAFAAAWAEICPLLPSVKFKILTANSVDKSASLFSAITITSLDHYATKSQSSQ